MLGQILLDVFHRVFLDSLVTSGKLGSINHTLLSFEAIKNRDIALDTSTVS